MNENDRVYDFFFILKMELKSIFEDIFYIPRQFFITKELYIVFNPTLTNLNIK